MRNDLPDVEPERFLEEIDRLERRSQAFGQLRLIAFLVALGCAAGALLVPPLLWLVAPIAVGVFPLLIVLHHRVDRRLDRLQARATLAREERDRRAGRSELAVAPPVPAGGSALSRGALGDGHSDHAYSLGTLGCEDLGLIEGPRSLFGLIDTSSTYFGAARLRWLLSHPLRAADPIRARQAAVRELSDDPENRRRLLASLVRLRPYPFDRLARGLEGEFEFASQRGLESLARLFGTLLPIAIAAAFFWTGSVAFIIPLVLVNFGIVTSQSSRSNPARDRLRLLGPITRALLRVESELETISPRETEWVDTHRDLTRTRATSEALLARIRKLEWHDFGVLFEFFNVVTLWELRTLPSAERLVLEHRDDLERALGALGQVEALLSLASLAAEREDFTWPAVMDEPTPWLEAAEVAHPLLDPASRIANSLALGRATPAGASTVVVTGSNMAGKSTYLKTVGINLVLASVGSAVCGRGMRLTPLQLFTDVNIRDSLDDGKSYFQVEVERVQAAVEAADESPFVLAIFDELFRGTNAHERFAISWSLVEHMTDRGALLLLATHDDRLAALVDESSRPEYRNVHFREHVEGTSLRFDYTLRAGPATTRNAIRVLEVSGYPDSIVDAAREIADRDR